MQENPIFDSLVQEEGNRMIPLILTGERWNLAGANARAFAAMREAGWAYGEENIALVPPKRQTKRQTKKRAAKKAVAPPDQPA